MLYKYLNIEGFKKTLANRSIRFSNINSWRKGSSNDCKENFIADCIESENAYYEALDLFDQSGQERWKFLQRIYYICIYTYKTYASCFVTSKDNQNYMWSSFMDRKGSVCIVFKEELFESLKKRYGFGTNISDVYAFDRRSVQYVDELPGIEETLLTIGDKEKYKQLAYFTKRREPYENEMEERIIITVLNQLQYKLTFEALPYEKDFDFSFDKVRDLVNDKMNIDLDAITPVYLMVDNLLECIDHVRVSPFCSEEERHKIWQTCNNFGIVFEH